MNDRTECSPQEKALIGNVSVVSVGDLVSDERARHEHYMALALDVATTVPAPFAAAIVDRQTGEVVCRGGNESHTGNRILHGEIVALMNCAALEPSLDWNHFSLYTTAEPCPMCASAIVWSQIPEVIYGTSIETLIKLGLNQIHLTSPAIAAAAPFYTGTIIGGILETQTDEVFARWIGSQ